MHWNGQSISINKFIVFDIILPTTIRALEVTMFECYVVFNLRLVVGHWVVLTVLSKFLCLAQTFYAQCADIII